MLYDSLSRPVLT